MSTQFYTQDQPAASQQDNTGQRPSRPRGDGPSWFRISAIVIGIVVAVALIVLAVAGLRPSHSTQTPVPAAPATTSQSANPAQPTTPAQTVNPAQPSTPPVTPSASVKKLQQELGQLNYYEGPVDGIMGPQTVAAVKDLQRQANLPQTGTMDAATQAALANYLAHGNNQMAG